MRYALLLLSFLVLPGAALAQKAGKTTKKAVAPSVTAPAPAIAPAIAPAAEVAPAAPAAPAVAARPVDPPAPDGFQKYYFIMLLKGTKLDQERAALVKMMEGHLEYMEKLTTDGKCLMDGTFMDGGTARGFMVVRATSIDEVKAVADGDPVVQAGRVVYEIHPYMTESTVFEKAPASK
jgi:uncharacterized protein YciI